MLFTTNHSQISLLTIKIRILSRLIPKIKDNLLYACCNILRINIRIYVSSRNGFEKAIRKAYKIFDILMEAVI